MNKYHLYAILLVAVIAIPTALAYAQEPDLPSGDIPISFDAAHGILIIIGVLGGLTTAYLGSRKAKANNANYSFDIHRFLDRVIIAVITSIGLAITAATGFVELNIVTIFLIFTSTVGTAELALQARAKNTKKTSA